jgi:Super-infection exclusion protein B
MGFNPTEAMVKWVTEHVSPYYMAIVSVFCAFFLWGPKGWLSYFNLWEFAQKYRWGFSLAFFFSIAVLGVSVVRHAYGSITPAWRLFLFRRQRIKALRTLPDDQLLILMAYVHEGRSTRLFQPDNGAVRDLENNGFLYRSSELGTREDGFPYNLRPEIRGKLSAQRIQEILIRRARGKS